MRLKQGMDPNGKMFPEDDTYEREDSPMICVARGYLRNKGCKRHVKTLDVLLRFGANVNQYNNLEQTPLVHILSRSSLGNAIGWRLSAVVRISEPEPRARDAVALAWRHHAGATQSAQLPQATTTAHRKQQQQFAKLVHDEIRTHVQHETAVRDAMLLEINDAKRIEGQRVYRAQLTEEDAKRKERRRKTRDSAKYNAFVAKIERKRLEHAFPMEPHAHEDSASLPRLGGHSSHSQTASIAVAPPELLAWEKRHVSGVTTQRPHWTPREVWTRHHASSRASSDALLAQCEQLHSTLQRRQALLPCCRPETAP
ncbi:hypothetical protein FI667_g6771, partial [Globisporangium splendens]